MGATIESVTASMKINAPSLLLAGVTVVALFATGCTVVRIQRAVELAKLSHAFQQPLPHAARRLLVVGDSTAVGTGASTPAASVTGLIADAHPDWHIVNRGRDGDTFEKVQQQLEADERFDLILIMAGGNDVFRLTRSERLRTSIDATLRRAHTLAPTVVCMPPGNVGNAPFFFAPWSWLMTRRARVLHGIVQEATAAHGSLYVNLFEERAEDPFAREPARYHAIDGLHPSDDGYALWHAQLQVQTQGRF